MSPTDPGPVPVTPERVVASLRSVVDPELGLSVVDLGLIYAVVVRGGEVDVTMTQTTPGCPLHETMLDWVREVVSRLPGVERVTVRLTFDPPWTPDRMAPSAR